MKKGFKFACATVCTCVFASCASVTPIGVSSNPVGHKKGVATELRIFGFATSECGIDAAAKNGGITKISHVEQRSQMLWPIFGKSKTIVYGE